MTAPANAHTERQPTEAEVLGRPVRSANGLRTVIATKWKTLESLLPKHLTQQRFAAVIVASAVKQPKIFDCTAASILNCVMQAASLGLEINAATGEAYIVPFRDTDNGTTVATLVPGYRGLIKLAIQSGNVSALEARLVYQGEEETFRVFYGTDSRIEHRPNFEVERKPDTVLFAYAVAKLPHGETTFEVMTRAQLDAIWRRSKSKDKGPWQTDREEMYRKTITRRICKYVPMSPQLAEAVELSDRAEGIELSATERVGRVSDLDAAVGPAAQASLPAQPAEQVVTPQRAAASQPVEAR